MDMKKIFLILLMAVFLAGCTSRQFGEGLSLQMSADPDSVFAGEKVYVYVDAENRDVKDLNNFQINVFEKGMLLDECKADEKRVLRPGELYSYRCILKSPEIKEKSVANDILAKATFETSLSFVQQIDFISKDEYQRAVSKGTLESKGASFKYSDSNIEALVEFSHEMPLVADDTEKFMYIKIRNAGNGFAKIKDIKAEGINCQKPSTEILNNELPRIACKINLPSVAAYKSSEAKINIDYEYDVRASASVEIKGGASADKSGV